MPESFHFETATSAMARERAGRRGPKRSRRSSDPRGVDDRPDPSVLCKHRLALPLFPSDSPVFAISHHNLTVACACGISI